MVGSTRDPRRASLRAEINVTPLVDVVLVLLIIFMVVTPLLVHGRTVQLPAAESAAGPSGPDPALVLTVTADRRLWLETRAIAESDVAAELARRAGPGRELLIKADASLSMRDLRPLLRRIKSSGLEQVAFAVSAPARERAR